MKIFARSVIYKKNKLLKINDTMAMIKQYLIKGAEVYINGQKL